MNYVIIHIKNLENYLFLEKKVLRLIFYYLNYLVVILFGAQAT